MADDALNHIHRGDGNLPLVFVHGFLCRLRDWHFQVAHFSRSHRVVACDLPGHGASPLRGWPLTAEAFGGAVAELITALDLREVVLVGHSMGCRVVMEARRQASERVAGLVLVDGSRISDNADNPTQEVDELIRRHGYTAMVENLFNGMFFGAPPPWKAEKMSQVLAIPESTGLPLFRSVTEWDALALEPALAEIDVPVHVIQSTILGSDHKRRQLEPGEISPYQRLVLERLPEATSAVIPAGHFSMIEVPDRVNASIARFLTDKVPGR
jgi:pimeloyl-ACP methyl ester carboxylesterase